MRFPRLAIVVVLVAAVVAGCGSSSGGDSTGSGQTVTIPADVHGFFDEQEAIFEQFPYQHWYAACLLREAEAILTPEEAEEIESEPQAEREERTNRVVSEASGRCEQSGRPTVDPNASTGELALLRTATLGAVVELAETNDLKSIQVECVASLFEKLSDKQIVELRNGTDKVREGILVSVFKPCSRLK